jgi:hypothetical protein
MTGLCWLVAGAAQSRAERDERQLQAASESCAALPTQLTTVPPSPRRRLMSWHHLTAAAELRAAASLLATEGIASQSRWLRLHSWAEGGVLCVWRGRARQVPVCMRFTSEWEALVASPGVAPGAPRCLRQGATRLPALN